MDKRALQSLTDDIPWSSISSELLLAELARRQDEPPQPQCGSGQQGAYNTASHVIALFAILIVSTGACAFPLMSQLHASGTLRSNIVFLSQHFGTGVLIATAFVHLLPTAFTSLTDPCLPYVFHEGYRPLAGLIAMSAALVVVALESYLFSRGAGHSHSQVPVDEDYDDVNPLQRRLSKGHGLATGFGARRASSIRPPDIILGNLGPAEGLLVGASPLPQSSSRSVRRDARKPAKPAAADDDGDSSGDENNFESLALHEHELGPLTRVDPRLVPLTPYGGDSPDRLESVSPRAPRPQSPPRTFIITPAAVAGGDDHRRLLIQCMLLEAGILFHSVFIGMALSVATGPSFLVFFVAIALHQAFEGLALGSRIAAIQFSRGSARPWIMVSAFGVTTPVGQAIGLAVHRFYDPHSQAGLLVVGIMNAISSGLLLFAGLVQLLAHDFLSYESYDTLVGRRRVTAYLAVLGGAGLMAAVGAFA